MGTDFEGVVRQLRCWLECHRIETEGVTLEVVLATKAAAFHAERHLKAEHSAGIGCIHKNAPAHGITINGVNVLVRASE